MTEKEKKAINNLWNSATDVMFNVLYSQEEMQEDIKVALNLIQRQQEDIQRMQECLDKSDANNCELRKEIKKKDKTIDEMVNSFAEEGFYSEHCQTLIDNNICTDDCNKCVKKYFERKVENT